MGDALEEVLDRHRRVWRARVWRYSVVSMCAAFVVGYCVRAWFG